MNLYLLEILSMKTDLQAIHDLEARVAKLEQKKAEVNHYKELALFSMRQAALMKAFGTYVQHPGEDHETLISVNIGDRARYVEQFMSDALYNMQESLKAEVM